MTTAFRRQQRVRTTEQHVAREVQVYGAAAMSAAETDVQARVHDDVGRHNAMVDAAQPLYR